MESKKPVRWWPLWVIFIANILALVWIWFLNDVRQSFRTLVLQVVILALITLWTILLSNLPTKIRLAIIGGVVAILFTFHLEGFSGDMDPEISIRWWPKATAPVAKVKKSSGSVEKHKSHFPQFLGPDRNGIVKGIKLYGDWNKRSPELLWKKSVGPGWSAFSVVEDFAITQEQNQEEEKVIAYDLYTGKVKWQHSDKAFHSTTPGGTGPRATPTIVENFVYTLGATGILNCLELKTGKRIWSTNILKENNAKNNKWGKSCSPLVVANKVIVSAGGPNNRSLVAYDKKTGKLIWGEGNAGSGYSSPVLANFHNTRQVLIFNTFGVVSHNLEDGKILWQQEWDKSSIKISQPLPLSGNRLFVSSGYGVGAKLFQINKEKETWSVKQIWKTKRMKAKFTTVVLHQEYLYGLNEGVLTCVDLKKGKQQWRGERYRHGQILLIDNVILVLSEHGHLALVEANPKEFKELSRMQALKGKTWNNPCLVGPYLLVRNAKQAACYKLPLIP